MKIPPKNHSELRGFGCRLLECLLAKKVSTSSSNQRCKDHCIESLESFSVISSHHVVEPNYSKKNDGSNRYNTPNISDDECLHQNPPPKKQRKRQKQPFTLGQHNIMLFITSFVTLLILLPPFHSSCYFPLNHDL